MPEAITQPAETQTSIEERVNALKGEAADIWKFKGDLAAAEAKNSELQPQPEVNEPDVTAASSPATETPSAENLPPSDEDDDEDSGTEATSDTALVGQPSKGLTPEQKSERKKKNDYRRYVEEKTKRELLERQLAEMKAAPAPAKPPEAPAQQRLTEAPEPPDIDDFEDAASFKAAMKKFAADNRKWTEQVMDDRFAAHQAQQESSNSEREFKSRHSSYMEANPGFKEVLDKFPGNDAINHIIRYESNGLELAHALLKNPDIAKQLVKDTTVENLGELAQKNPQHAAYLLGMARGRALTQMQSLLKSPTAPPRQPTGQRSSSEVRLERPGIPSGDARSKAIADGDFETFKKLENERLRKA